MQQQTAAGPLPRTAQARPLKPMEVHYLIATLDPSPHLLLLCHARGHPATLISLRSLITPSLTRLTRLDVGVNLHGRRQREPLRGAAGDPGQQYLLTQRQLQQGLAGAHLRAPPATG